MYELDRAQTLCRSILVVEDEKTIRESLVALLENEGYTVYSASNGKNGLEALKSMPRPCLILLDFMMPIMNGQEFLENKLHDEAIASIPVVVVSAYEDEARTLKSSAFIKKPIDFDALLKFVNLFCGSAGGALGPTGGA